MRSEWRRPRGGARTFVALLGFPQVDLGDGLEVDVPKPHATVASAGGEALLAGVHAKDPCLKGAVSPAAAAVAAAAASVYLPRAPPARS